MISMQTQGISRRRFLAICGGGMTGIWLATTGFVQLPAQMVFAMSGSCSFCGKAANEIFGLAGVTSRDVRVCNECIELCFDILSEEIGVTAPPTSQAESGAITPEAGTTDAQMIEVLSQLIAKGQRGDPLIEALAAARSLYQALLKCRSTPTPQIEQLVCSFCDRNGRDVAKLIAGPSVYICDGCVGDAGALFMRYGWRPGVE
jgi:hypothetical protein